jgi:hypothetical protein
MRLLDRSTVFLPLESLGLGSDLEKPFARLIHMPTGSCW